MSSFGWLFNVKFYKRCIRLLQGNKAQFSTLDLDVSKQLAVRYKEREMEERAEKEKLKQLVLEINERQEEEEQAAIGERVSLCSILKCCVGKLI